MGYILLHQYQIMPLTQDEIRDVTKLIVRCNIDLNQGMNAFLESDYSAGRKNLTDVLTNVGKIIEKVHD